MPKLTPIKIFRQLTEPPEKTPLYKAVEDEIKVLQEMPYFTDYLAKLNTLLNELKIHLDNKL